MFAYDKRAFSHGCMRVQDPPKYAEVLLSLVRPGDGYTRTASRRCSAPATRQDIQFPTFIPVNLTYQTAFVDDDGKLQFRDDIYGRDKALLALLKGDERKIADIADRAQGRHHATARFWRSRIQPSLFGGGRNYGGPERRQRLLLAAVGGGFAATPPQPVRHAAPHRRETSSGAPVQR